LLLILRQLYVKVGFMLLPPPDEEQRIVMESRIIKSGKMVFATEIVPTLDPVEFDTFKILFKKIIDLIEHIQSTSKDN